ncbi:hypothetical protein K2173_008636 [Erythroxylum novogranatense]|uniref:Uncharacterized protein n=1 Tax=Erythroxylum novogranatense TaxID=1862640 RepID=A0AAV8SKU3_9ROSI|nr:hypothetical protein K2173_008636 [Erythroxylum novogranatense]
MRRHAKLHAVKAICARIKCPSKIERCPIKLRKKADPARNQHLKVRNFSSRGKLLTEKHLQQLPKLYRRYYYLGLIILHLYDLTFLS